MNILTLARSTLLGALGIVLASLAAPAQAGVATTGAVLLDPFDPVPEIQFHHFGGYGCGYGCGQACDYGCEGGYRGCGDVCGGGCSDGCRHHYRRHDCDDGCRRNVRDDCDRDCGHHDCDHDCDHQDCGHDCHDGRDAATPCQAEHCYNAEHYERRWRDGERSGMEWLNRGSRERTLHGDHHGDWYGLGDPIWHDDDDAGGTAPVVQTIDPHAHDHDHDDDHPKKNGPCFLAICIWH